MASHATRSVKLDLRLSPGDKAALQAAAAAVRRSVSEFVLESALSRADETLADRRVFSLNAAQWKAFLVALEAPPRPLPRLQRLLQEPGFFDTKAAQPSASGRAAAARLRFPASGRRSAQGSLTPVKK